MFVVKKVSYCSFVDPKLKYVFSLFLNQNVKRINNKYTKGGFVVKKGYNSNGIFKPFTATLTLIIYEIAAKIKGTTANHLNIFILFQDYNNIKLNY